MKFTVHREAFGSSLALLTGATSTRAPNLQSVLLTADPQRNVVTAVTTNLHLRIATTIPAKVTEAGSHAVPASRLLAMIRAIPAETVHVSPLYNGSKIKLSGGAVVFEVPALAAEEFPKAFEIQQQVTIAVDQNAFVHTLQQVACCQSTAPDRESLNSTRVIIDQKGLSGTLTASATNARMLARTSMPVEISTAPKPDQSSFGFIVPRWTVDEIVRVGNHLVPDFQSTITFGRQHVSLTLRAEGPGNTTRDIELSSVLLDLTYPDDGILKVIERLPPRCATITADILQDTLQRILLVCENDAPYVDILFDNEGAVFKSRSDQLGAAKDLIPYCEPMTLTKPVSIKLNPRFMLNMIRPFTGNTVRVHLPDNLAPNAIPEMAQLKIDECPAYRGVIVPIRTEAAAPQAKAA